MGPKADLAERDLRYRRIRAAMEREGLVALIAAGKGSHFHRGYLRYFTDTHMWAGDGLVLMPLEKEPTLAWVTYAGPPHPGKGWITDVRRAIYPEKRIVDAMKEKGITHGKVGIAGLRKVMNAGTYLTLTECLPNVQFVNADVMTDRVRVVASPLEVEQMRQLWKLGVAAMQRFIEIVGPGMTQRDVAGEATKVIRAGGSFDDLVLMQEGDHDGLPGDIPLKCDDLISLHMEFCGESGHWVEIETTVAFRDPTRLELKLMDTELRAQREICKMAKPGVRLSDMARVFEQVVVEDGWELGPATRHCYFHGHTMDDFQWPWWTAQIEDTQDAVLEEGMILCYHPHRPTIPALPWGMTVTDEILITPHGAERLSGDWDFHWRIKK